MRTSRLSLAAAAALLAASTALPAQAPADPKSATGIRKEIIAQLDAAEQKYVQLAQAIPQEKYAWRPAEGVRSVSEVFVHVAGANLMLPGMAGVKREHGVALTRDAEKTVTDRAQIVDLLRKSFAHARQAVMDVPDREMDAAVSLFGQQSTKRGVLLLIATHAHEHLGQSIAYARMNGVVPPWSQREGGGGDR